MRKPISFGPLSYRLADNGTTILVSSGQVAEMRLRMAAQGLPLLDELKPVRSFDCRHD